MKRSIIYSIALAFCLFIVVDLNAQGRGHGNRGGGKKEYRHHDRHKVYRQHAKNRDKSYKEYYKNREKAYRKYVKNNGKRYRDHDAWYYDSRFYRRDDYVYFPKYRTYYDPYHRRYVYRRNNNWIYSQAMPSFMVGVNLGGLAIQFMGDLPIRVR